MRSLALAALPLLALSSSARAAITSPKAFLGFEVCADYQLADYGQLTGYWRKLAGESNRIQIVEIGKTEGGRPQLMAIVSDPANLKALEGHRRTSERFARAAFRDEAEAVQVARAAKPVVWIDGGLHANETLGAQQLIETAYRLVSGEDEETRRIRRDVVTLLVQANPDGMDLVSRWYMRRKDPAKRSLAGIPELYQRYAGHDNNRDFYAMNLAETRNMSRVLYREWYPQIVYNHHQSAPRGTIMYVPPFRNPFNHNVDALVQNSTDLVGTLIQNRLIGEGKGGTVSRDEASFSSW
ncbi:peptidase, partial [bacterium]